MYLMFKYKEILIEANYSEALTKSMIDELMRRRLFIAAGNESTRAADHVPRYFHMGYKGEKVSVRITRDIKQQWYCSLFSVKTFSAEQPPLFVVD